jgi:hypothetical protein
MTTGPAVLPLLGFLALRHTLGPADPHMATDPSATACHVRGLATSFAASTTGPTGARSAGASMGFALQGVPLGARGAPLGALALLTLPATPPPGGSGVGRPPSGPCSRDESVPSPSPQKGPGRRCLPGLFPSRALTPSARAIACSHDAGPLALGRDDVPARPDLRASRIGWLGVVRLRTAGSPGVWHLSTVTALRPPPRGAGSWFHLTQDAALVRDTNCDLSSLRGQRSSRVHGP